MTYDIQSVLAPVIVFLALAAMIYFRSRKKGGDCGAGCGCSKETKDESLKK